jgi:hypothetical protein
MSEFDTLPRGLAAIHWVDTSESFLALTGFSVELLITSS